MSSFSDIQQPSPMTLPSPMSITQANKHNVRSETPEYGKYRPYFGWVNTDTIRDTFRHTTQLGVLLMKVCLASNYFFSSWEGPGVNVGSRISETS